MSRRLCPNRQTTLEPILFGSYYLRQAYDHVRPIYQRTDVVDTTEDDLRRIAKSRLKFKSKR